MRILSALLIILGALLLAAAVYIYQPPQPYLDLHRAMAPLARPLSAYATARYHGPMPETSARSPDAQNPFKIPYIRDMATRTAISVEEYLHTSYRPDCDYVDGELVERNVGEYKHSLLQLILAGYFRDLARRLPIRTATELRMRVRPTRFRIPDIMVMLKSQHVERVPDTPPFLCIEILSPEDRTSRVLERVHEYLDFGVPYVWVIDPEARIAYSYTEESVREVHDQLTTANPEISIPLADLFAELDEAMREEP